MFARKISIPVNVGTVRMYRLKIKQSGTVKHRVFDSGSKPFSSVSAEKYAYFTRTRGLSVTVGLIEMFKCAVYFFTRHVEQVKI